MLPLSFYRKVDSWNKCRAWKFTYFIQGMFCNLAVFSVDWLVPISLWTFLLFYMVEIDFFEKWTYETVCVFVSSWMTVAFWFGKKQVSAFYKQFLDVRKVLSYSRRALDTAWLVVRMYLQPCCRHFYVAGNLITFFTTIVDGYQLFWRPSCRFLDLLIGTSVLILSFRFTKKSGMCQLLVCQKFEVIFTWTSSRG